MIQLTLPSPAKLNLFLHILNRRPDGYHTIQTVYQFLNFCDELVLHIRHDQHINLLNPIDNIANDDNLIIQAARLLQSETQCDCGVDIDIHKKLPIGAGIGGGSSNAATVLLGLNRLWDTQLSIARLAKIGQKLGADVPFFIHGHAAWAEGIGYELQEMILPEHWYVVLIPNCHVNTKDLYQDPRLTRDTPAMRMDDYQFLQGHNDFEPIVRVDYPTVSRALDFLSPFGEAKMSGTGSVVFCAFDSFEQASRIAGLARFTFNAVVVQGLNQSPLHLALLNC